MSEEKVFGSKVLKTFYGDKDFPVEWESDEEKKYHWFYDDLHCPNPLSPIYQSTTPWWGDVCAYMYRRFWAPFGKEWLGKVINRYCYTAIKPRDAEEVEIAGKYYFKVMPIYARKFLAWWNARLLPEVQRNYAYLDNYDYESATLGDLMILLEDYLDIYDRHFKLHWILNLAQFQATLEFRFTYQDVFGKIDEEEVGRILVSLDDKNWDCIRGITELAGFVKSQPQLLKVFESEEVPPKILEKLKKSGDAKVFFEKLDAYLKEYGFKTIYPHEYQFETWIENPTPVIELIRTYLKTDYDVEATIEETRKTMEDSIREMLGRVKKEEDRKKLKDALELAMPMQRLTPDHHFWLDQGCHSRGRTILLEIGKRLVDMALLERKEDVVYLYYNELRSLFADEKSLNSKALVKQRKQENQEAEKLNPPDWLGTVTQWSNYEEPYKTLWGFPQKAEREPVALDVKEFKGIPGSAGVVEGKANVVRTPAEFDKVRVGDIMVCRMTSPAWITVFPKLRGLVTEAGGMLSHPAIVSREFGIPAVVGTGIATQVIKSGQQIRVDGSRGVVEILD